VKRDYEYVRRGTANIFCVVEPRPGRHQTHATPNRKGYAFARALQRVSKRYPKAHKIHLVVDNLNTHGENCLREHLGDLAGKRVWKRFIVHYTPKHASWLNPAEMEASLVSRECLGGRRVGDYKTLRREVAAWNRRADRHRRRIEWKWRVSDARRVFRYDGIITIRAKHSSNPRAVLALIDTCLRGFESRPGHSYEGAGPSIESLGGAGIDVAAKKALIALDFRDGRARLGVFPAQDGVRSHLAFEEESPPCARDLENGVGKHQAVGLLLPRPRCSFQGNRTVSEAIQGKSFCLARAWPPLVAIISATKRSLGTMVCPRNATPTSRRGILIAVPSTISATV
jgi:DDE superfamily endonuclease